MRSIFFAALMVATPARAEPIHDEQLDFSFTLPPGYHDLGRHGGNTLHTLGRDGGVMQLQAMSSPLPNAPFDRAAVEKATRSVTGLDGAATFAYQTTQWHGHTLTLTIVHMNEAGVVVGAQVPLAKAGLKILANGKHGEDERLVADVDALVASIDGKSNWDAAAAPDERGLPLAAVAGALLAFPLVIWLLVWLKRRRKS